MSFPGVLKSRRVHECIALEHGMVQSCEEEMYVIQREGMDQHLDLTFDKTDAELTPPMNGTNDDCCLCWLLNLLYLSFECFESRCDYTVLRRCSNVKSASQ